jgi:hypothetical protein
MNYSLEIIRAGTVSSYWNGRTDEKHARPYRRHLTSKFIIELVISLKV